jgi:hypothetical protein
MYYLFCGNLMTPVHGRMLYVGVCYTWAYAIRGRMLYVGVCYTWAYAIRGRMQYAPTKFNSTIQPFNCDKLFSFHLSLFNIHPDYRLLFWYRDFALLNYGKKSRQSRPSVSHARLNLASLAPVFGNSATSLSYSKKIRPSVGVPSLPAAREE